MNENNIDIKSKTNKGLPHNCLVKLLAIYDSLQSAEKRVADLLLERVELFKSSSVNKIAKLARTSEATIVRFSQKLGYDGYLDLKSNLNTFKNKKASIIYDNILESDDFKTLIKKVYKTTIISLRDTLNVINIDEYKKAVDALYSAKKIIFCGEGDASTVAKAAYLKFHRVGMNTFFPTGIDSQLIAISSLDKNDILFTVSHSGRTKSIVELSKYAKMNNSTIISITNYPLSPLAKNSDIVLLTATFAEDIMGEGISRRVAELFIVESIYISLIMKHKERFEFNFEKSNQALLKNKIVSTKSKSLYYRK